jgi:hypothetical protein
MIDRRSVLRLLAAAFLTAAAASNISSARSEASNGMIGSPLATVVATSDFFTFFHLERVAGPTDIDAAGTFDYRPSGGKFRPLVRVRVRTGEHGVIAGMSLVLLRSFIDDPANTLFARDIAKSFLSGAPPRADATALADLRTDIEKRGKSSATVLVGPNYQPPTGDPSPDYAVFTGEAEKPIKRALAQTEFVMLPVTEDGKPALAMSLERRR